LVSPNAFVGKKFKPLSKTPAAKHSAAQKASVGNLPTVIDTRSPASTPYDAMNALFA
jgi:hypothetical protein